MDIGTIFLGLAMLILTGAIIARPLIERSSHSPSQKERRLSTLQAERDRVLTFLEELEMDHTMGKLLDEDFLQQRSQLVSQGAEILRQIDELRGLTARDDARPERIGEIEDELEAAVRRLRAHSSDHEPAYCGACGSEVAAGDLFCVQCGTSLSVEGMRE